LKVKILGNANTIHKVAFCPKTKKLHPRNWVQFFTYRLMASAYSCGNLIEIATFTAMTKVLEVIIKKQLSIHYQTPSTQNSTQFLGCSINLYTPLISAKKKLYLYK